MTESIIIVGGGSAGWMTAAMLIHSFPEKKITVIEDPGSPPIGVGESTFDGIRYFCEFIGIDQESFFKNTDASIKIGLSLSNFFNNKEDDHFVYPFGEPYIAGTKWGLEDWMIKKYVYPDTPIKEFAESYFAQASLIKHNKFSENNNGKLGNFNPKLHTALHFDAIKFGAWLRDHFCLPKKVNLIKDKVINVELSENGISSLILSSGNNVSADLFIDCTGFKSLLLDKVLKEPFISYEDVLPNNRAWATRIPYKDKERELRNVTTCTAIESGWCWDIPLWSRLGSGYVYSDKYETPESALEQFKNYLMSDNIVVPRTREEVDSLQFNDVKMRVGIHERTFVKNVVAIGLSAGFIEPLESNGLFTVHEFLFQLVRALQRGSVSQWDRDVYNRITKETFDGFVDFIRLHYALTNRTDTKYWKDIFNNENNILNSNRTSFSNRLEEVRLNKTRNFYAPEIGGTTWITSGMNYHLLDNVSIRLGEIKNNMNYKTDLDANFKNLELKQKSWEDESLQSPSMYEYLKLKYYEE